MRIGCAARIHLDDGRVSHVEARGERLDAGAVVAAVPWYALVDLFAGDTAPVEALRRAAAATRPSPIASVNLWLESAGVCGRHFSVCPAERCNGCSTRSRCSKRTRRI